ncbi:hypothetical protein B5L72_33035, partial [Pseudomonas aeruginosa]
FSDTGDGGQDVFVAGVRETKHGATSGLGGHSPKGPASSKGGADTPDGTPPRPGPSNKDLFGG